MYKCTCLHGWVHMYMHMLSSPGLVVLHCFPYLDCPAYMYVRIYNHVSKTLIKEAFQAVSDFKEAALNGILTHDLQLTELAV